MYTRFMKAKEKVKVALKKPLTVRMRQFAAHYAEHNNGKAAAIAAGYSEKSAATRGSQLLRDPRIADEVLRLRGHNVNDVMENTAPGKDMTKAALELNRRKTELMDEIHEVIYRDPLPIWQAAGFGADQLDALEGLDVVDRRQVTALKQTHTVRRFGRGNDVNETEETVLEVKMRPRDPAMMRMARHVGIGNTTTHEHTGKGGGPIQHEHKGLSRTTINAMITQFLGVPAELLGLKPEAVVDVEPEGGPA